MRWCGSRLLKRTNSPDLCTGLVYACRFCGLLDASVSAHLQAPASSRVPTVSPTYLVMGNYERCLEPTTAIGYAGPRALRHREARRSAGARRGARR
jgi:hypothetical protein